jgi:O-antigen/teichoic acid export membrane protein
MRMHGQMMTRTGTIFALGLVSVVPFGVLSIAVTTRYLDPHEYGQLAILFAIGSVVTMFCGIGFQQGVMISVFGIADDGEDGGGDALDLADGEDIGDGAVMVSSNERRRLLGSGLLIVLITTTALCLVVAAIGVAVALSLGGGWVGPILWMTASAWAGGLWRMMHQIPRMERRAVTWAWLQWARPAFVVLGSIAALIAGFGISGVLAATAIGTLAATAGAYVVSRDSFRFEYRREDWATTWKAGRAWVPLIFAVAIQTNVSVLLLGIVAAPSSVGLFQVASRIGAFPIYFADGFVTAWPALERSQVSFAAKELKGVREYSSAVFTLLALTTLGLLVLVCLSADAMVHIAAPAYASASTLIPIVAANGVAYVVFRGVFRATGFPRRRYWYTLLHLLWILPFAAAVAILVPINASYGVAIAQVIAGSSVAAAFVFLDRRSSVSTPFQWRRLGTALLVAIACVVPVQMLPLDGLARALVSLLALAAFPLLLLALRAVPLRELGTVLAIIGSTLPQWRSKKDARLRLAEIPDRERRALVLIAAQHRDPTEAAEQLHVSESVALARMVRGLRRMVGETDPPTPFDHEIGRYVLYKGSTIEKDVLATHLREVGIDPLALYLLDDAAKLAARVGNGKAAAPSTA